MYDPTVGRFLTEDPIGLEGGDFNFYRYCGNSPTNATDPLGLKYGSGGARNNTIPETLGERLRNLYYSRAAAGVLIFSQVGLRAGELVYHEMHDDGIVEKASAFARDSFLVKYAMKQNVPQDGKFHKLKIDDWTDIFSEGLLVRDDTFDKMGNRVKGYNFVLPEDPDAGYASASFWTGGLHSFDVKGEYEIQLECDGWKRGGPLNEIKVTKAQVRNIDLKWRWTDSIDARGLSDYPFKDPPTEANRRAGWGETILGDWIGDTLLGASYWAHINFSQKEVGPRDASYTERRML